MPIHTHNEKGFEIYFEALDEDITLEECLPDDTPAQIRGLKTRINNGNVVYFCAKVSAHKAGIELGDAYLGACIYDSYEQFYEAKNDYFADLVAEAITEAEEQVAALCPAPAKQIPFDRALTPAVLREYAELFENIEREYEASGQDAVWSEQFDDALRRLDFEVFNACDSHDITRCTQ